MLGTFQGAVVEAANPQKDLGNEVGQTGSVISTELQSLEAIEKSHILRVLENANWRIEGESGAAQILGLHPNTLRSRLKKLGLNRPTT
ncbi:MAG: helix-turn-helix domain-containing protein [Pirellulales bacterium]